MARLVFVHAHPDDETLATGVAIAHYAAGGHDVHVVTATLGEHGEIIPPELAHLGADRDDTLGEYRRGEFAAALRALGATGHHLGGPGRYRDSGMAGMPSASDPRAFASADVAEAAGLLGTLLRDVGADVVVSYDRGGGYGHPDHIQTRRVLEAALAGLPSRSGVAAYEVVVPRSWAAQDREWLAGHVPDESDLHVPAPDEPYAVSVVDDALVTHVVLDEAAGRRQVRALQAHRTQVRVVDGYYALSNAVAARLATREAFVRLDPATGERVPPGEGGWASDLLAPRTDRPGPPP